MKCTIRRLPITNNKILRTHWARRRSDGRAWIDEIRAATRKMGGPFFGSVQARPLGMSHVSIHVDRSRRAKVQDPDNQFGSVKILIDALKKLGWIVDDSTEWMQLRVKETNEGSETTKIEVTYE